MFDFISLQIYDPNSAKFIEFYDFNTTVNTTTGEIQTTRNGAIKYTYQDRNLEFISYQNNDNQIKNYLRGSFHKYKNNGVHNADTFTYLDFVFTVMEFCKKYEINPELATIHKLEFGVNLIVPNTPKYYIDAARCYQRKKFDIETFANGGLLLRFNKGARKEVKVYDKTSQYHLAHDVLRFELKLNKGNGALNIGASTLLDLLDYNTTRAALNELETALKSIIWTPLIKVETLTSAELNFYHKYRDRDILRNIDCRHRYKRIKDRLAATFGTEILEDLTSSMSAEAAKILELPKENPQRFNHLQNEPIFKQFLAVNGNEVCNVFTTLYRVNALQSESKVCLITGCDISNQKKGSKFVSAKEIGYKPAHDIRNTHSNPRNNLRCRLIKELAAPSLFDPLETISLTKEQKELLKFWTGTPYIEEIKSLIN